MTFLDSQLNVQQVDLEFLASNSLLSTAIPFHDNLVVLQLRLWLLERLQHHVPDIPSGLTEIEAHTLTAETLAHNVELDAILVDHVGNSVVIVVSFQLLLRPTILIPKRDKLTHNPHQQPDSIHSH